MLTSTHSVDQTILHSHVSVEMSTIILISVHGERGPLSQCLCICGREQKISMHVSQRHFLFLF